MLLESYPSPFIISVHAPELLAERKAAEDKKKRRLARREARRAKREEEEKADKEAKRALGGKGGKGSPRRRSRGPSRAGD